jgi:hypothetical protein
MRGNFFGGAFFGGGFFGRIAAGVRKRTIRLSELDEKNRLTTAEFLKSELRKQFPPLKEPTLPGEISLKEVSRKKLEIEAVRNMQLEAENEKRIISLNNQIIAIILSSYDES